jgi:hypothetical protein
VLSPTARAAFFGRCPTGSFAMAARIPHTICLHVPSNPSLACCEELRKLLTARGGGCKASRAAAQDRGPPPGKQHRPFVALASLTFGVPDSGLSRTWRGWPQTSSTYHFEFSSWRVAKAAGLLCAFVGSWLLSAGGACCIKELVDETKKLTASTHWPQRPCGVTSLSIISCTTCARGTEAYCKSMQIAART